jgi:hypothetical protein
MNVLAIGGAKPAGLDQIEIKRQPASEVSPGLAQSASYWNPRTPCATIAQPDGDGF